MAKQEKRILQFFFTAHIHQDTLRRAHTPQQPHRTNSTAPTPADRTNKSLLPSCFRAHSAWTSFLHSSLSAGKPGPVFDLYGNRRRAANTGVFELRLPGLAYSHFVFGQPLRSLKPVCRNFPLTLLLTPWGLSSTSSTTAALLLLASLLQTPWGPTWSTTATAAPRCSCGFLSSCNESL